MTHFSLHAVGQDRPGIVAAVAGALEGIGCNLEDSRMTILRGQFAIMLVLDAPAAGDGGPIEEALAPVARELDLLVAVRALPEPAAPEEETGEVVVVSVHGADHPGIVARMAAAVARDGGNVVDLTTRVVGDPSAPGYVMVLTVSLPPGVEAEGFGRGLAEAAAEAGVHCSVAPGDAAVL